MVTPTKSLALVLHWARYSESSRIVTLFGKEEGKVVVMAKGLRRVRGGGRLAGLEPISLVEAFLHIKPTRAVQNISQVNLVETFNNVKSDLLRYSYGSFICELTNRAFLDLEPNPQAFNATYRALQELENGLYHPQLVLIRYLIELVGALGFALDPFTCPLCGKSPAAVGRFNDFYLSTGQIACHHCRSETTEEKTTRLSGEAVMVLRALARDIPDLWRKLKSSHESAFSLIHLLLRYLQYHHPLIGELKTLKMIEELAIGDNNPNLVKTRTSSSIDPRGGGEVMESVLSQDL